MHFKTLFTALIFCLLLGVYPLQLEATDKIALLFLTRSDPNHPILWKTLICEASKKYNTFFMEAFWTRFIPSVQEVLAKVENGLIGDVKYIKADFAFI